MQHPASDLTWSQLRAYQTTGRQSCNGRENSMTDNGRRCSLTIYSARLVDRSVSMRRQSVISEACRLHGSVVAQHTRRAGELKSEGLVDAGQWGRKRQEGFNTLPPSARTPHEEATSTARIAQKARAKSKFAFCDFLLRRELIVNELCGLMHPTSDLASAVHLANRLQRLLFASCTRS